MAKWKCGWCGVRTHMTSFGDGVFASSWPDGLRVESAFRCDECDCLSTARYMGTGNDVPSSVSASSMAAFWATRNPETWAPRYIEGQDFPDVPTHIAQAAGEAHKSASIGNRMSAILMARTVIEATAKDQEILKGTLEAKIDKMRDQGLVRPHIAEEAHEVRHFGNDMAHGDINEPVDDDDVSEVLALMDEVLNEVYQSHARLAKVRDKRLAKRDAGA